MKKIICLVLAALLVLSFTTFAADFIYLSSTVNDGVEGVYVEEGTISFTFSDVIKTKTVPAPMVPGNPPTDITVLDAEIGVYKNGDAMVIDEDYTITFSGPTFNINFVRALDYSTPYSIDFSTVKSASDVALSSSSKSSISFTTEARPDIILEGVKLTKGIGSSVTEQTDGIIEADSSIQGFNVSLKNVAAQPKTVTIVCALYQNGIIKRVLTSEKTIDATSTEMVELGTSIESGYAGGVAKIYIWDNLSNRTPFIGARTYEIQ